MMLFNDMFPGNYLKGADLDAGPRQAIIRDIKMEDVSGDNSGDRKPVLRFQGTEQGLVLNKTNGSTLSQMFGPDTAAWIGQTIEIYFDPTVSYGGRQTGGLRVRAPTAPVAAPMQPAPMQPAPMQPAPMQPTPMQPAPMQPAPMPWDQ